MIAENFMFVMVEHNQFVGVKTACSGMKQRLAVICRIVHYVLVVGKNGVEMKVILIFVIRFENQLRI